MAESWMLWGVLGAEARGNQMAQPAYIFRLSAVEEEESAWNDPSNGDQYGGHNVISSLNEPREIPLRPDFAETRCVRGGNSRLRPGATDMRSITKLLTKRWSSGKKTQKSASRYNTGSQCWGAICQHGCSWFAESKSTDSDCSQDIYPCKCSSPDVHVRTGGTWAGEAKEVV